VSRFEAFCGACPCGFTFFRAGVQTSIMQNLQYFEHLSEPMAEMLSILDSQYDHSQLGDDILK
jgi:hypothetical protein